ncbi:MAG: hypothetical protein INR65_19260, partial [Gluconacetobacter diazotrophicus]|nr:hypothetical protein [Gluconacetobacter diazotrophicus]
PTAPAASTPAHAWLRPRLEALVAEAGTAGITPDVAVAVMNDILTDADFATGHLASDTDA